MEDLPAPATSVGIFGFCSDDEEKVKRFTALMDYRLLSFERGEFNQVYDYDDIKDYRYSPQENQRLAYHHQRYLAGTPDYMEEKLKELAAKFDTEEIIIATFAENTSDRLRSYELIAERLLK